MKKHKFKRFKKNVKQNMWFFFKNLNEERNIFTHLTDDEKIILYKTAKNLNKNKPLIVEIGSYLGSSTCFLAAGLRGKNGMLYCIDTWKNDAMTEGERDTYSEFCDNTKKYQNQIKMLRGYSNEVVDQIKYLNKPITLLFIDGNHSYEATKKDWDNYSLLMERDSIVIFHDISWAEGVNRVIHENIKNRAKKIFELKNMIGYNLNDVFWRNLRTDKIKLEYINCDLCGKEKYNLKYSKPDSWLWVDDTEFNIVQCKRCGLAFLNPRPTLESMIFYYPSSTYYDHRKDEDSIKRYRIQIKFLSKLSNQKVLDLGCARGDFLIELKKKYPNIKLVGVDSNSNYVNSKDIEFYDRLLMDCKFYDNEFDLITSWAVLEHVHTPGKYFEEISRILKPGGKFIFLVTNFDSLYSRIGFWEDIPRHVYFFSRKTLKKYAKKFNFKLSKIYYNDEIFDGRGLNSFEFLLGKLFGIKWLNLKNKNFSRIQRVIKNFGEKADKIIFKKHWESKMCLSGIIIVEFTKND